MHTLVTLLMPKKTAPPFVVVVVRALHLIQMVDYLCNFFNSYYPASIFILSK